MKYLIEQYKKLVSILSKLQNFVNLLNYSDLHFLVYTQFAKGLDHNAFYFANGKLAIGYDCINVKDRQKLFNFDADFLLYPEGCNDSHIKTAVKNALKEI